MATDCISVVEGEIKISDSIINSSIDGYISKGCYGYIFIGSGSTNKYIIKIIPASKYNYQEVETMKAIMDYNKLEGNNNIIPNYVYLLSYYLNCNKIIDDSNDKLNIIKSNIRTSRTSRTSRLSRTPKMELTYPEGSYSILIIEQFDGTIKQLLSSIIETDNGHINRENYTADNIELFNSIFAQITLSLYILHNKFNYYHNDAHLSNIFYKKIAKDNKYFHYIIKDINYYIKNCGYLVVLGDFGLSTKIIIPDNLEELEQVEILQEEETIKLDILNKRSRHSPAVIQEINKLNKNIEERTTYLDKLQLFHLNLIRDYNKLLKYLNYAYIQSLGEGYFSTLINDNTNIYHLIRVFLTFTCYPDTDSQKYIMCKNNIKRLYTITQSAKLEDIFLDIMMSLFKINKK